MGLAQLPSSHGKRPVFGKFTSRQMTPSTRQRPRSHVRSTPGCVRAKHERPGVFCRVEGAFWPGEGDPRG